MQTFRESSDEKNCIYRRRGHRDSVCEETNHSLSSRKVVVTTSIWTLRRLQQTKKKNCKGGNVGIEYLRNEIRKIAASGDTFITTLLDFFRLPNDFPNYTTDKTRVTEIEQGLTDAMTDIVSHNRFLPYIQLHEVEALMFIKVEGFELLIEEDRQRQELQKYYSSISQSRRHQWR